MLLLFLAFAGGALTILSPCILPVLPFVFARSGQSFLRGSLPMLIGMAVTFAAVATLAAVGGAWAARFNTFGRVAALALVALFGVALVSRRVADWIARPFTRFGNRLTEKRNADDGIGASILLGVATGFLWAPCAGPILGLILTGAAINGPSAQTTALLFAYALGAIASLSIATLAGQRIFATLRRSLSATEWLRRGLGVAVLIAVVAIGLGWDTGLLTRWSTAGTQKLEESLLHALPAANASATPDAPAPGPATASMTMTTATSEDTTTEASVTPPTVADELRPLDTIGPWINSAPISAGSLHGQVVLIDFWTYSCINCIRTLPYLKAWNQRYKDHGLTIIGVHAPEFAFEKVESNVRRAVRDLGIDYPVVLDNDFRLWRAFDNRFWPAHYFIDAQGRVRGHQFGEGNDAESEALIRKLLVEAGHDDLPGGRGAREGNGAQAASDDEQNASPETYIGYERAEDFASTPAMSHDVATDYALPLKFRRNQWGLEGNWTVRAESATASAAGAKIRFRFHARDLHLVLAPSKGGRPVRIRVTLDDAEPGASHGADIDEHGNGTVQGERLYQLIRQSGEIVDRSFTIEFLDEGVRAYSFTFG